MPQAREMSPGTPEDTIAAIATPPGEGAIGIVRLSGPDAIAIASKVFVPTRRHDLATSQRQVFHGEARDGQGPIDEVLVHVMRGPHSYTCEDIVEINCHGGAAPLQAVLEAVLARGARLATPGEFTRRAFLNGRIDLVQAEAVIDRVRAGTRAALRAANAAATGRLSRTLHELSGQLANALARIEAAVDFPDEDLPELVDDALRAELEETHRRMTELLDTAKAGRLYREGAGAAIVGRPNVGKSSLFNALLRDARAIVTPEPGTTRDLIEEIITIGGVPVRLSDTAGLRTSDDQAEQIGVQVARNALQNADIVLLVVDASEPLSEADHRLAREVAELEMPAVVVLNKTDLVPDPPVPDWADPFVRVSALTGQGLKELEDVLGDILLGDSRALSTPECACRGKENEDVFLRVGPDQGLITRIHQADSLRRAVESTRHLLDHFDASPEFLSLDLRQALSALGEITGQTTPEDILDRIFSTFCIGK